MVEKISEVSMSVAMKGASTPDDHALLKQIVKKKKQDKSSEMPALVAMLPPAMLVQLTTPSARGGGLQKTEKLAAKQAASDSPGLAAELRQTKQGDGLRRQVAQAVAGQMASTNRGSSAVSVRKGEVNGLSVTRASAGASTSGAQSTTPVATQVTTDVSAEVPAKVATKLHPSATPQHPHAAARVNPLIVTSSAPVAEADGQKKPLRNREESGEARPLWQEAKQPESLVAKPGETVAHSRNSPVTLAQLKTQAGLGSGVKSGNDGQTLEVNYQFQRWTGDHSVRVSVPADARRDGNVTLLPSDVRAADVLLRNMGQLTGLSPDLLRPQQERDEQQQQRRQQQQQDEDQE
ncbi:type III secretion system needle length determinant, SpaN/EivJ family [uncultured Pantoea sp.]|uniref:SpaN/EivJ family type III secretion system needle length determinant n=1 Tax=uncultured Pantoea sp. TaxID=218084 RepID=UPI00258B28E6|nr:type III secretion system needle length determinant, SpaN/EivJ family [uncultured Pantoea sp.]